MVLSDHDLPGFDSRAALALVRATGHDVPFIVVSGQIGEAHAVEMLKAGAHDFVLKSEMARLATTVRRALSEAENRRLRLAAVQELPVGSVARELGVATLRRAVARSVHRRRPRAGHHPRLAVADDARAAVVVRDDRAHRAALARHGHRTGLAQAHAVAPARAA